MENNHSFRPPAFWGVGRRGGNTAGRADDIESVTAPSPAPFWRGTRLLDTPSPFPESANNTPSPAPEEMISGGFVPFGSPYRLVNPHNGTENVGRAGVGDNEGVTGDAMDVDTPSLVSSFSVPARREDDEDEFPGPPEMSQAERVARAAGPIPLSLTGDLAHLVVVNRNAHSRNGINRRGLTVNGRRLVTVPVPRPAIHGVGFGTRLSSRNFYGRVPPRRTASAATHSPAPTPPSMTPIPGITLGDGVAVLSPLVMHANMGTAQARTTCNDPNAFKGPAMRPFHLGKENISPALVGGRVPGNNIYGVMDAATHDYLMSRMRQGDQVRLTDVTPTAGDNNNNVQQEPAAEAAVGNGQGGVNNNNPGTGPAPALAPAAEAPAPLPVENAALMDDHSADAEEGFDLLALAQEAVPIGVFAVTQAQAMATRSNPLGHDEGHINGFFSPAEYITTDAIQAREHNMVHRYHISRATISSLESIPNAASVRDLLFHVAGAIEFQGYDIPALQRSFFSALQRAQGIQYPMDDGVPTTGPQKLLVLLQADLSGVSWPNRLTHAARLLVSRERAEMYGTVKTILRCLIDIRAARLDGLGARNALKLLRSVSSLAWEQRQTELLAVKGIGPAKVRALAASYIETIEDLARQDPMDLERILRMNPPRGTRLKVELAHFPQLRLTSTCRPYGPIGEGRAIIHLRMRYSNSPKYDVEGPEMMLSANGNPIPAAQSTNNDPTLSGLGVPVWEDRMSGSKYIPWVTLTILRPNGQLAWFWRGSLKKLRNEFNQTFVLQVSAGEVLDCELACDTIVGTGFTHTIHTPMPGA